MHELDTLNELLVTWRAAEDNAKAAADIAEKRKLEVIAAMNELGLKAHESDVGKVAMVTSSKCNIVVERKDFETMLKNKGMYDQFCTTKFDLTAVKKYCEGQDDDLYGMVEIEQTQSPRFTAKRD